MPNPTDNPLVGNLYTDILTEIKELLPRNYIGGLITSNDTDADHDVNIAVGECRSDDDTESLRLTTEITKRIDAAWAVGDDAGGLDTGNAVANQLYLLWLIKRSDTGVVDAIFSILGLLQQVITVVVAMADDSYADAVEDLSIFKPGQTIYVEGFTDAANNGLKTVVTSAVGKITVAENLVDEAAGDVVTITATVTGPTMPANYDSKRLIAAVKTDPIVNIVAYLQSGDYFRYMEDVSSDVNDATITALTWETAALSAPPMSIAHFYGSLVNGTSTDNTGNTLYIRTKGSSEAISTSKAFLHVVTQSVTDAITKAGSTLIDNHRQIEYAAPETTGASTVRVYIFGFTMLSRREP